MYLLPISTGSSSLTSCEQTELGEEPRLLQARVSQHRPPCVYEVYNVDNVDKGKARQAAQSEYFLLETSFAPHSPSLLDKLCKGAQILFFSVPDFPRKSHVHDESFASVVPNLGQATQRARNPDAGGQLCLVGLCERIRP